MLHRFLFVAGMTAGVMLPLVWAAYVARPLPRTTHAPAVRIVETVPTKAAPEIQKPPHAPANDVTASIPPAPAVAPEPVRLHPTTVVAAHDPGDRILPAVVDTYNGAHIITVCAALTGNEQLRAGCP